MWWWWSATRPASTAAPTLSGQVEATELSIAPALAGRITSVKATEGDRVAKGDVLVQLDTAALKLQRSQAEQGVTAAKAAVTNAEDDDDATKADVKAAKARLAQAEAALGQAVRQVRTLYVNNASLAAQVRLREADVGKARTQLASAEQDLARRQGLAGGGAVSGEELAHAKAQVAAAQSTLAAAQAAVSAASEQRASNEALTDGTPVEQHPSVLAAAAKLREAWLA